MNNRFSNYQREVVKDKLTIVENIEKQPDLSSVSPSSEQGTLLYNRTAIVHRTLPSSSQRSLGRQGIFDYDT